MRREQKRTNYRAKFSEIVDRMELREYLSNYTNKLHNAKILVHYTRIGTLQRIHETRKWRLGNPLNMNDKKEVADFPNAKWKNMFYTCFVANASESIAMWSLYGRPWADGISITIPYEDLRRWIQENEYLYIKSAAGFEKLIFGNLRAVRIAYTNELTKDLTEKIELSCGSEINNYIDNIFVESHNREREYDPSELAGLIKDRAWSYENEIRIRADIPESYDLDAVYIDVPEYILEKMIVTAGPMFYGNLEYRLQEIGFRSTHIKYSSFSHHLQKMPCTDYLESDNKFIICPERTALDKASSAFIVADKVALHSYEGVGTFQFLRNGQISFGDGDYLFTINWHRVNSSIVLEHAGGQSLFIKKLPNERELYDFEFPDEKECYLNERAVLLLNEDSRVLAVKALFSEDREDIISLEYKIYAGVKIEFFKKESYYNKERELRKKFKMIKGDKLCGNWEDELSKRCHLTITKNDDTYFVKIQWASSAWEYSEWTMSGKWDPVQNRLQCHDEKHVDVKGYETNTLKVTTFYENGESSIRLEDEKLYWDDATKSTGFRCRFVKYS